MSRPVERVLRRIKGVKRTSAGWEARCPAHDDRKASLSISEKSDGTVLLKCHAGCLVDDVVAAVDLTMSDLFLPKGRGRSNEVRTQVVYPIRDLSGNVIAEHVRLEDSRGKKIRMWWRRDGKSGLGGLKTCQLPLYGTERLAEADNDADVIISEGEKAADAAGELDVLSLGTVTGASGVPDEKVLKPLSGRAVVLLPDNDEPGQQHMEMLACRLESLGARVRMLHLPGLLDKGDAADWVEAKRRSGRSVEEIRAELDELAVGAPIWQAGDVSEESSTSSKPTQAQLLVESAADAELFHTPGNDGFASITVGDHRETWPIRSNSFRQWLVRRFYHSEGKPPGAQALQDALRLLEARAQFDGDQRAVFVRLAGTETAIYLDLCNDLWEVVEITPRGWSVVSDPPVRFRRACGMLPLPRPVRGGSLNELRPFVNVASNEDFVLLAAFIVGTLQPGRPYPLLDTLGEHGSAKSTVQRVLRSVIDPSTAPLRSLPKNTQDLAIAANNSWVLVYDNLSGLSSSMSDALCRIATGGGLSTRRLYTDDSEAIFDAMRPIMVNGIDDSVVRGDLMDRSISVSLPCIPKSERRSEREFWREFDKVRPRLLGALLDAASIALRNLPDIRLNERPRMADFAEWVTAAEPALPWEKGAFLKAYQANRRRAVDVALDSDRVAVALRDLIDEKGSFEGTMTEILKALGNVVGDTVRDSKGWPKSPRGLSGRIRRAAPFLRSEGIEITELPRQGRRRPYLLEKGAEQPSQPSQPSQSLLDGAVSGDGSSDGHEAGPATVTGESPATTRVCDGSDDSDGLAGAYSKEPPATSSMILFDEDYADDEEEVAV